MGMSPYPFFCLELAGFFFHFRAIARVLLEFQNAVVSHGLQILSNLDFYSEMLRNSLVIIIILGFSPRLIYLPWHMLRVLKLCIEIEL